MRDQRWEQQTKTVVSVVAGGARPPYEHGRRDWAKDIGDAVDLGGVAAGVAIVGIDLAGLSRVSGRYSVTELKRS